MREAVKPLAAYGVLFRYPGPAEPTHAQVAQALAVAEQVWQAVTQRLPAEAVP